MYLWDIMGALRRRWYIVIPGLLVTVIAAGVVTRIVPQTYQATGSVLLISPAVVGGGGPDAKAGSNPYLNFGNALGAAAEVVSASVNSDETAQQTKARGATGSYIVAMPPNSDAPLVSIEATASDGAMAIYTMNTVIGEFRARLLQVQQEAGAPSDQYIRAQSVTTPKNASVVRASLIRALAVVLIVGVLFSCGAALILEAIRRGRVRRRSPSTADDQDATNNGPVARASRAELQSDEMGRRTVSEELVDDTARMRMPAYPSSSS